MRQPKDNRGLTYKSAMSSGSGMTDFRRDKMDEEDEYDEPFDMPWVDRIKPRLAPDWLDFDKERVD